MPDIDGKRKFFDIKSQIYFDVECIDPPNACEELIQIGRFNFYKHSFEKANAFLFKALAQNPSWIVIDEIGKLEIENKGLYPSVKEILNSYYRKPSSFKLLIVIRQELKELALSYLHIEDYTLIHDLKRLSAR